MEIINTSHDLSKGERYKLTKSPAIQRMREVDGTDILMCGPWAVYTDESMGSDGQRHTQTILSVMDLNTGVVYATNSATFQREFSDLVDIFGPQGWELGVYHGKTKAGRDFISATYCGND